MQTFTIWQWIATGISVACVVGLYATYRAARGMLPTDIPADQRQRRGWWARIVLYQEKDRQWAEQLIKWHRILLAVLILVLLYLVFTTQ